MARPRWATARGLPVVPRRGTRGPTRGRFIGGWALPLRIELDAQAVGRVGVTAYMTRMRDRMREGMPARAWEPVKQVVFAATAETFKKEGAKEGYEGWSENVYETYLDWKFKRGYGGALLVLTGKLRDQLTGRRGDHFEQVRPKSLTIGSNYPVGGSSGQRSGPWTAVGGAILPEGQRWSIDTDSEDVGGLMAEGTPATMLWDPVGENLVDVPGRPMWRFTSAELDMICEHILNHTTISFRRRYHLSELQAVSAHQIQAGL